MVTLKLILRNRLAAFGGIVLLAVCCVALLAPLLPLADPDITDPVNRLKRPFSEGALLGTDHLGRDLLSRLIWGTRLSLAVGIAAALIAAFIGSAIGIVAGFYGGRIDDLTMRGIDMLMAFPYILLALAIVAVLGPGLLNALYAGESLTEDRLRQILSLFRLEFADPRLMKADIAGRPVYLAMAMTDQGRMRLKPQNLLTNLPLAGAS